jgi:5-methylcytosine-specific restriction endonuclease McrA
MASVCPVRVPRYPGGGELGFVMEEEIYGPDFLPTPANTAYARSRYVRTEEDAPVALSAAFTDVLRWMTDLPKHLTYQAYLQSPAWKLARRLLIERAQHRCQRCHARGPLNVHHLTYERLGHEEPGDLQVLCRPCHMAVHGITGTDPEEGE